MAPLFVPLEESDDAVEVGLALCDVAEAVAEVEVAIETAVSTLSI